LNTSSETGNDRSDTTQRKLQTTFWCLN
jgi:hypothetical protein